MRPAAAQLDLTAHHRMRVTPPQPISQWLPKAHEKSWLTA
jgi:hypothetical protein